jgi:hypothetical protein
MAAQLAAFQERLSFVSKYNILIDAASNSESVAPNHSIITTNGKLNSPGKFQCFIPEFACTV